MKPHTDHDEAFFADLPTDYSRFGPLRHGKPGELVDHFREKWPHFYCEGTYAEEVDDNSFGEAVSVEKALLLAIQGQTRTDLETKHDDANLLQRLGFHEDNRHKITEFVDELLTSAFHEGCQHELDRLEQAAL